jgi:hypothetical protein
MPYAKFDRSRLRLKSLSERVHDLDLECLMQPNGPYERCEHEALPILAGRIRQARDRGSAVIFMLGAHVIRKGASPLLIDLMGRGYITHIALNGAGSIHDYELALIGKTCESVAKYVSSGEFGLWRETGGINSAATSAHQDGIGLGEAIGRAIEKGEFPYRHISVLAAGYRLGVPVTVHVAIGQDIIHEHPNFDGAATGAASYADFLIFAQSVCLLEGGVMLNMGTAVMGPEVYLKALTMARNVAHQEGRTVNHFTTAVFDLVQLDTQNVRHEAPKTDPRYYFRPYKTTLVRTVADGGESYYVQGDHRITIPTLYHLILDQ